MPEKLGEYDMVEHVEQGWTEEHLDEIKMLFEGLYETAKGGANPNMLEFWKGWLELLGETEVSSVLVLHALKEVHPNSMHAFQPGEPGVVEVVVNHPAVSQDFPDDPCYHRFVKLTDCRESRPYHLWVNSPNGPRRSSMSVEHEETVESMGHTGQMHRRLYLKFEFKGLREDLSDVFTQDLGWHVLVGPS